MTSLSNDLRFCHPKMHSSHETAKNMAEVVRGRQERPFSFSFHGTIDKRCGRRRSNAARGQSGKSLGTGRISEVCVMQKKEKIGNGDECFFFFFPLPVIETWS